MNSSYGRRVAQTILRRTNRTARQLAAVGFRLAGQKIIHFLHIGKTGGTAIKHALQPYRCSTNRLILFHGHDIRLADVPEGEGFFFFLRDPVSRFVSGFYSRKRKGRPRFLIEWSPQERIAFERFDTPNELALAISSRHDEMKTAAAHAMKAIDHVSTSYWDWLGSEEYLLKRSADLVFVGFQENLAEDFQLLIEHLGILQGVTLPGDPTKAHRSLSDGVEALEHQAIMNLNRWYSSDYECLELCKRLQK